MLRQFNAEMREGVAGKDGRAVSAEKRADVIREVTAGFLAPDPDGEAEPDPTDNEVYSGEVLLVLERLLKRITPFSLDPDPMVRRNTICVLKN